MFEVILMWTDNSVLYQIYTLGAFGCPFENDNVLEHRFKDIDLWINQLKDLNIDAVLFNPIFQSHSHGYDTIDYYTIDNRLGDNKDFKYVSSLLHKNGIRIILDAVFNHVGRGFFAFEDVLKNRENSHYKDWFYINFYGNSAYDDHLSYQDWEGNQNLVKLNLQNPEVVEYIMNVVQFWNDEFEIDGLRLDVAYCLDQNFLKTLHSRHHDLFLMGETLHGDYNMWVNDQMLDSCTNYECYKGLYSSLNSYNLFEIMHSLHRQFGKDNWCLYRGKHLVCFVDNHDVPRIATQLQNENHLPLIYGLLMTMPGIPCIYYGSEWGIKGQKNWNDTELRPHITHFENNELTKRIKRLIEIKHEHSALHTANFEQIVLNNTYCIFKRNSEEETLYIAINISNEPVAFNLDLNGEYVDLIDENRLSIDHVLEMPAYSLMILKAI